MVGNSVKGRQLHSGARRPTLVSLTLVSSTLVSLTLVS
jgi:hypothetical protein